MSSEAGSGGCVSRREVHIGEMRENLRLAMELLAKTEKLLERDLDRHNGDTDQVKLGALSPSYKASESQNSHEASDLSILDRKVIDSLAQLSERPGRVVHRAFVAAVSGFAQDDGEFVSVLIGLADKGFVRTSGLMCSLTDKGQKHAETGLRRIDPSSLGPAILNQLSRPERVVFAAFLDKEGQVVNLRELSTLLGPRVKLSSMKRSLATLQRLGLIEKRPNDSFCSSEQLLMR